MRWSMPAGGEIERLEGLVAAEASGAFSARCRPKQRAISAPRINLTFRRIM